MGLLLVWTEMYTVPNILGSNIRADRIIEQWDYCLFGPKCIPSQTYWGLTSADKSVENFIAIRKSWDTFLVEESNELGSRIPIGWCLPSANASANWTKYLKDNF
ncbi:Programmed cell death protein 7 [Popillia japonica]|uniref:Programmed cell death protein 7 n=1 Tax=Popillia japonica TaxID=7064 RepID=A0AAW1JED2_POPJA